MAAPRRALPPFKADAKAGPWLSFRLLAAANPARAHAPAWSAPEIAEAAQAEGLGTTAGTVRTALRDGLGAHGLIERANRDARDPRDVAWSLSDAVRVAARAARHCNAAEVVSPRRGARRGAPWLRSTAWRWRRPCCWTGRCPSAS